MSKSQVGLHTHVLGGRSERGGQRGKGGIREGVRSEGGSEGSGGQRGVRGATIKSTHL